MTVKAEVKADTTKLVGGFIAYRKRRDENIIKHFHLVDGAVCYKRLEDEGDPRTKFWNSKFATSKAKPVLKDRVVFFGKPLFKRQIIEALQREELRLEREKEQKRQQEILEAAFISNVLAIANQAKQANQVRLGEHYD